MKIEGACHPVISVCPFKSYWLMDGIYYTKTKPFLVDPQSWKQICEIYVAREQRQLETHSFKHKLLWKCPTDPTSMTMLGWISAWWVSRVFYLLRVTDHVKQKGNVYTVKCTRSCRDQRLHMADWKADERSDLSYKWNNFWPKVFWCTRLPHFAYVTRLIRMSHGLTCNVSMPSAHTIAK